MIPVEWNKEQRITFVGKYRAVKMSLRLIKMIVSYEGTRYHGYQIQPGVPTIQGKLQEAIAALTGVEHEVTASGRTDAGVHARAQVCHVRTGTRISIERLALAVNARLPEDIRVISAEEADESFHARRSAKRKTYRYTLNTNRFPDVFMRHLQYHHFRKLNVQDMREALKAVVGEHDFTSFCSIKSVQPSHVRTLYQARLIEETDHHGAANGVLHIYLTGNGFLYNMVRIIVGTVIEVGEGKRLPGDIQAILEARDRAKAGPTAVPKGLMLWEVEYDEGINGLME